MHPLLDPGILVSVISVGRSLGIWAAIHGQKQHRSLPRPEYSHWGELLTVVNKSDPQPHHPAFCYASPSCCKHTRLISCSAFASSQTSHTFCTPAHFSLPRNPTCWSNLGRLSARHSESWVNIWGWKLQIWVTSAPKAHFAADEQKLILIAQTGLTLLSSSWINEHHFKAFCISLHILFDVPEHDTGSLQVWWDYGLKSHLGALPQDHNTFPWISDIWPKIQIFQ